jgi:hypothetical protein
VLRKSATSSDDDDVLYPQQANNDRRWERAAGQTASLLGRFASWLLSLVVVGTTFFSKKSSDTFKFGNPNYRGAIFFAPLTTSCVVSRDLNLKFEF